MQYSFEAIGFMRTKTADEDIPRHWSDSSAGGYIDVDSRYAEGISHIAPGDEIVVLFAFIDPSGLLRICSNRHHPVNPDPKVYSVHARRCDPIPSACPS